MSQDKVMTGYVAVGLVKLIPTLSSLLFSLAALPEPTAETTPHEEEDASKTKKRFRIMRMLTATGSRLGLRCCSRKNN